MVIGKIVARILIIESKSEMIRLEADFPMMLHHYIHCQNPKAISSVEISFYLIPFLDFEFLWSRSATAEPASGSSSLSMGD